METVLLFILGVMFILVGIGFSIGLHEFGHLIPAKLFNVRVPKYAIGFGPRILSLKKGETEYSIRLLPLGGFITMIGMYPPLHDKEYLKLKDNTVESDNSEKKYTVSHSTGIFQQLSEETRIAATEEVQEGDENRMFYNLPVWKRITVMLGGPLMNGVLAVLLLGGIISMHGTNEVTTTIGAVQQCIVTEAELREAEQAGETMLDCDDYPPSPAAAAGLLPGDRIISFNGEPVNEWTDFAVRQTGGDSFDVTVERTANNGEVSVLEKTITPIMTERPIVDENNEIVRDEYGHIAMEKSPYVGVTAHRELVKQPFWHAPQVMWGQIVDAAKVIYTLPVRVYEVGLSTVHPAYERDPNGPMSIVGVGNVAGEIASCQEISVENRFVALLSILAGLNTVLMVLNLVPLLPLDAGHVVGALYESIRRRIAKLRGKPDPGPVDISKILPITYVVAISFVVMAAVLILSDIFNPISIHNM